MADPETKALLLELMKQPGNKTCMDCGSPMPQWASLSFGTFICLSCSGQHRGLGVHITFVRSISMDKWTEDQIKYMKQGGNAACKEFFEASPDYNAAAPIAQKYTSHLASTYKSKLAAQIAGRPWSPSQVPAPLPSSSSRPSTPSTPTSSLRKPKLGTALRSSTSPLPSRSGTPIGSPNLTNSMDGLSSYNGSGGGTQKERNESYFASLGATNANRPDNLPPSQGGKYAGFGSTSYTPGGGAREAEATSSRALPTLDDLRDDPAKAVQKGWGFLSSALGQVGRVVNESVVQPGMRMAQDPNLQKQGWDVLQSAGQAVQKGGHYLGDGLRTGGEFIKRETGYDVGQLGANYVDRRPETRGYGTVDQGFDDSGRERGAFYGAGGREERDFFEDQLTSPTAGSASEWNGDFGFGSRSERANDGGATTPKKVGTPPVKGMKLGAKKVEKKTEDKWEDW